MGCLFTRNIIYCPDFILPGINSVFLANRSQVQNFTFDTGDTKMSEIQTILPLTGITWYEYTTIPLTTNAFEKEVISNNGRWFFQKEFDFTIDYLEPFRRSTLMDLINSNNIMVVYKSKNGNWFIMGDDYPCKVIDYSAALGTSKDQNQYSIKLGTEGRYQMRNIETTYVETYILPYANIEYIPDCEYFVKHPLYNSLNVFVHDVLNCYINI